MKEAKEDAPLSREQSSIPSISDDNGVAKEPKFVSLLTR